jgi:hypothetical protein
VGVYAGMNWTSSFFSEIGYEYAHGDSFRSVYEDPGPAALSITSQGKGRYCFMYSKSFGEFVTHEPVDRNSIGFNAGLDLGKELFSSSISQLFIHLTSE